MPITIEKPLRSTPHRVQAGNPSITVTENADAYILQADKNIIKVEDTLEALYGFALSVLDFDISVVYDMCRIDEMTVGEVFELDKQENLKEKLDDYVLKKVRLKYE